MTAEVKHSGGQCFDEESEAYDIIYRWMEAGAKRDEEDVPDAVGISFEGDFHQFSKPGGKLQLKVTANYSDGSTRDVTRWTVFSSNNDTMVPVTESGLLTAKRPGAAHVFARFDKFSIAKEIITLSDKPFTWSNPATNNYIDELVYQTIARSANQSIRLVH